jgi:hypothetical protein
VGAQRVLRHVREHMPALQAKAEQTTVCAAACVMHVPALRAESEPAQGVCRCMRASICPPSKGKQRGNTVCAAACARAHALSPNGHWKQNGVLLHVRKHMSALLVEDKRTHGVCRCMSASTSERETNGHTACHRVRRRTSKCSESMYDTGVWGCMCASIRQLSARKRSGHTQRVLPHSPALASVQAHARSLSGSRADT